VSACDSDDNYDTVFLVAGHLTLLFPSLTVWLKQSKNGKSVYICKICPGGRERKPRNCMTHEALQEHQGALAHSRNTPDATSSTHPQAGSSYPQNSRELVLEDALRSLLRSATAQPTQPLYPPSHPSVVHSADLPAAIGTSQATGIDWGVSHMLEDHVLEASPLEQAAAEISQATFNFLNGDISEDEDDEIEVPDSGDDSEEDDGKHI